MEKNLLILITLFFCNLNLFSQAIAQLNNEVKSIIKGQTTFNEIVTSVESYYDGLPNGREDKSYKHWARWAHFMSYHTDADGKLTDIVERVNEARERFSYANNSRSSVGNWVSLGPASVTHVLGTAIGIGRADRIAFHPSNEDIIYVGTSSGGLWKSVPAGGGQAWLNLTDALPTSGISGVVVNQSNPNSVYILTGDGDSSNEGQPGGSGFKNKSTGVFVSYDGGINWVQQPLPISDVYFGFKLIQSSVDTNILIAATSKGICKTINAGQDWSVIYDSLTYDVEFKPNSNTIYAVGKNWFVRSDDLGVTWDTITAFTPSFDNISTCERLALAVTPAASNNVYIHTGNAFSGQGCGSSTMNSFKGIFRSTNAGFNFSRIDNGNVNPNSNCCNGMDGREQVQYDHSFAVSRLSTSNMVAAGIIPWRSTNGGFSFAPAYIDDDPNGQCGGTNITGFIHGDIHDLEYQPGTNRLYACSDGGVYYSDNHGLHWNNINSNFVTGQAYHLAVSNVNSNVMMIGQQDNGTRSKSINTSVWNYVGGADGYDCIYNWNSNSSGYFSVNSTAYHFTNNGQVIDFIDNTNFFPRVCSPINNDSLVIIGSYDIEVREKINGNWAFIRSVSHNGNQDIERCPSNASRFYFAGGNSYFSSDGIFGRTDDYFDNAIVLTSAYPQRIADIAVHPSNSATVWKCFGGYSDNLKVYKSTDAGLTWTNMSDNLPNVPCFSLAIHNNGDTYVGTQLGVYYRNSSMNEWIPFDHGLPKMPVTDIEISQGKITAATFGRGVWQSDLYSNCATTASITNDMTGRELIERSQQITATNQIYGGASSDVIFKAGNQISLLPGFHVPSHNNFSGYLRNCGEW